MNSHLSTKILNGYSTAFRQWRASHSHCKFIHGYALKFKVTFSGKLDDKNWVCDFGSFKRNGIKEHMSYMFDHTTIVAKDDPELAFFQIMDKKGLIQLRILDHVGCEKFAEYVFSYINSIVSKETNNRVLVEKVECFEGDTNNSAIFKSENHNKSSKISMQNHEMILNESKDKKNKIKNIFKKASTINIY